MAWKTAPPVWTTSLRLRKTGRGHFWRTRRWPGSRSVSELVHNSLDTVRSTSHMPVSLRIYCSLPPFNRGPSLISRPALRFPPPICQTNPIWVLQTRYSTMFYPQERVKGHWRLILRSSLNPRGCFPPMQRKYRTTNPVWLR